jgi:hypothetical protein
MPTTLPPSPAAPAPQPPPADSPNLIDDEDETLRTDTQEWQESPSVRPDRGEPTLVAERMTEGQPEDTPEGADGSPAITPEGEVVGQTDFYPGGLPGPRE